MKVDFNCIAPPSDTKFIDVSSQLKRTYRFPNNELVVVSKPVGLHVCCSGDHIIVTENGATHSIPRGWLEIIWVTREGSNYGATVV